MNELGKVIREEIQARGQMMFARYMELALYHPALGYYAGETIASSWDRWRLTWVPNWPARATGLPDASAGQGMRDDARC